MKPGAHARVWRVADDTPADVAARKGAKVARDAAKAAAGTTA